MESDFLTISPACTLRESDYGLRESGFMIVFPPPQDLRSRHSPRSSHMRSWWQWSCGQKWLCPFCAWGCTVGWPQLPACLTWVMRPPEEVPASALDAEILSYRPGAGSRASCALDPLLLPKPRGPREFWALLSQGLPAVWTQWPPRPPRSGPQAGWARNLDANTGDPSPGRVPSSPLSDLGWGVVPAGIRAHLLLLVRPWPSRTFRRLSQQRSLEFETPATGV